MARFARLVASAFVVTLTLVGIQHTEPAQAADPTGPFIVSNNIR